MMKSHLPVLHPSRSASPQRSSYNQTPASRSLLRCWAKGVGWQWRQQVACGSNKRARLVKKKFNQPFFPNDYCTREAVARQRSHLTRLYKSHILLLVIALQWMNLSSWDSFAPNEDISLKKCHKSRDYPNQLFIFWDSANNTNSTITTTIRNINKWEENSWKQMLSFFAAMNTRSCRRD